MDVMKKKLFFFKSLSIYSNACHKALKIFATEVYDPDRERQE
jgi:hypothetical protein